MRTSVPTDLAAQVDAVFSTSGPLEAAVPEYEPREGQQQMARAVASVLRAGGVLLAEAGTGTGKTLAYLVPALLSGQRVLVSTGTKNLQEQILLKDVPLVGLVLGRNVSAALMKGRANYLCLHRFDAARRGESPGGGDRAGTLTPEAHLLLPIIGEWAATTETGDRAELADLPEDLPFWNDIAATADTCVGSECPQYQACFVTRMRQRAAEADLVVVNHHLLFADAAVRQDAYGEVIPPCPYAVLDEAHQLEDVATQYFGVALGARRLDDLARDAWQAAAGWPDPGRRAALERLCDGVKDASKRLFATLELLTAGRREERLRVAADTLADAHEAAGLTGGALTRLAAAFGALDTAPAPEVSAVSSGLLETAATVASRATRLAEDLQFLVKASDPDFVFFLEPRGKSPILRAAPIDVSRIVRDRVLDRFQAAVLTSATLTVDGSYEYVRSRLGVGRAIEVRVPSEFDYTEQAILYLPRHMPPPRTPEFADAVAREVIDIVRRTEGRAFVLFTSYGVLRAVQPRVEMALPFPVLVQGSAPRSTLVERFRSTPHAVLLATSSFWQGVDVVGEALSCVIIDKLPFASPADPVTAARMDAITAGGGDAFADYQVPVAILTLLQGLGRLIRHRRDRGVLAILDPRLRTMGYGRRFLASLPPAPVVFDPAAIERFLRSAPARPGGTADDWE